MNETQKKLKVAVVGAGAIGGICAGFIRNAGFDVQIICRNSSQAHEIETQGIRITGVRGEFTVAMPAADSIETMKTDRDIVLLGVKAIDMVDAANRLKPMLGPDTLVVSLQNGLCEETLADILGRDRVIGCVTGWGATRHAPCRFEMTSLGEFIVGNIDNLPDPRIETVAGILSCIVPAQTSSNIVGSLYSKLIINACITSVGAVCGLYLGEMTKQKNVRRLFFQIMKEAMDVARGLEITVEPYAGRIDFYTFLDRGIIAAMKRHLVLIMMGVKFRRLKSSSLQSLERGQKTEIEYLTGYIVSNGRRLGIPTPVNTRVMTMIREIEDGRRPISARNLDDLTGMCS